MTHLSTEAQAFEARKAVKSLWEAAVADFKAGKGGTLSAAAVRKTFLALSIAQGEK